jgi:hypothetical protein
MKKNLIAAFIVSLFIFLNTACSAQKKSSYIPEKGYWVLVSNKHDKKNVTVQFYTNDNTMIYEETLHNTRLNANRKKLRMQLCAALTEAYDQWAAHVQVRSNDLIAKRK